MISIQKMERKAFANKYTGEDALTGKDVIDMLREIKELQEENGRLLVENDELKSHAEFVNQYEDVMTEDLIESMKLAEDLNSLEPVKYALRKTANDTMRIQ